MPFLLSCKGRGDDELTLQRGRKDGRLVFGKRVADLGDNFDFRRDGNTRRPPAGGWYARDRSHRPEDESGCPRRCRAARRVRRPAFASTQNSPSPESSPARWSLPISRLSSEALTAEILHFRPGRRTSCKGKFRIGKDDFDVGAFGPFAFPVAAGILRRDAGLDVRVMHHHP